MAIKPCPPGESRERSFTLITIAAGETLLTGIPSVKSAVIRPIIGLKTRRLDIFEAGIGPRTSNAGRRVRREMLAEDPALSYSEVEERTSFMADQQEGFFFYAGEGAEEILRGFGVFFCGLGGRLCWRGRA